MCFPTPAPREKYRGWYFSYLASQTRTNIGIRQFFSVWYGVLSQGLGIPFSSLSYHFAIIYFKLNTPMNKIFNHFFIPGFVWHKLSDSRGKLARTTRKTLQISFQCKTFHFSSGPQGRRRIWILRTTFSLTLSKPRQFKFFCPNRNRMWS